MDNRPTQVLAVTMNLCGMLPLCSSSIDIVLAIKRNREAGTRYIGEAADVWQTNLSGRGKDRHRAREKAGTESRRSLPRRDRR
jgi:hypothetical protein